MVGTRGGISQKRIGGKPFTIVQGARRSAARGRRTLDYTFCEWATCRRSSASSLTGNGGGGGYATTKSDVRWNSTHFSNFKRGCPWVITDTNAHSSPTGSILRRKTLRDEKQGEPNENMIN